LRLLLRAARHPMLLTLQYGGALLMATALGSAYADMEMDLYGAQNRFGLFFFILFYLCLSSMSSLPVWRDEQIVFEHEWSSGLYGYAAYYLSIVGFDLILVRAVPPLAFVFITYEWAGLRSHGDSCLYAFAAILILTNLIAALVAMMIGAVRLPNATANVIGALVVLYLALCGGYLLNPSQLPPALRWLATIDPLRCVRCAVPPLLLLLRRLTLLPSPSSPPFPLGTRTRRSSSTSSETSPTTTGAPCTTPSTAPSAPRASASST
jgi:hypothetical protein